MAPATFRILDIQLFERGVVLRLPFRFGVVTPRGSGRDARSVVAVGT
jgi:hypothetical protein